MKNRKKLILATCLLPVLLSAQSKLELGIRLMPQLTGIRYDYGLSKTDNLLRTLFPKEAAPRYIRFGVAAGVGVTWNPLKRLRFGADLLFSGKGGGFKERKTNLNYLEVPLWIGFNSLPSRKLVFTFQTGIGCSLLIGAKMKYSTGETVRIVNYVNRTSWGIPLAIGVRFRIHSTYFLTTQLYVYSDLSTLSRTNEVFDARNYVYPGLRLTLDRNFLNIKNKP